MRNDNYTWRRIKKNYDLYILFIPVLLYFIIFQYGPMFGIQIAFKDFMASKGIWGSPWKGFQHFERFFSSYNFNIVVKNTLILSVLQIIFSFPLPILLALLLNELKNKKFKSLVQTATYAPYFISMVVLVGILNIFFSPTTGLVNTFIKMLGQDPIYFFGEPQWFRPLYILSGIWQSTGWQSIIYLAALSNIDVALHEAALVDGATKLQRIFYIDIPGIIPTAVILLILAAGRVMNIGFEKTFLMQTSLNLDVSEVISTYTYKVGLLNVQYSYATAIGLFNSVINLILITIVNAVSKKYGESSLW
mgnify:CR=1 FL=1